MKRCPKCNRTFPDDNQKFCTVDGGLLVADAFDPNATVMSSPAPPARQAGSKPEDIHTSGAPTITLNKNTGPTGSQTFGKPTPPPQPQSAPLPQPPSGPLAPGQAAPPRKKSKLPLVLGILAILFVLGVGAAAAAFFLVIKPKLDEMDRERGVVTLNNQNDSANENANTTANTEANNNSEVTNTQPEFVPPPDAVQLMSSNSNLDGKLAEHYFDFSFYYPNSWVVDPKAGVPGATSFAKVERSLPPDFTQENFSVGWYDSKGTFAADEANFPRLVETLSASLSRLPEYRKVSEGPTKVNTLDGYEFRYVGLSKGTEKGDIQLWGRVIFLPPGVEGETTGATLSMLTTSLAPELSGVDDVGAQGQMPIILESFRFGKR